MDVQGRFLSCDLSVVNTVDAGETKPSFLPDFALNLLENHLVAKIVISAIDVSSFGLCIWFYTASNRPQ